MASVSLEPLQRSSLSGASEPLSRAAALSGSASPLLTSPLLLPVMLRNLKDFSSGALFSLPFWLIVFFL